MSWTIQPILTGWIHGYKGHFLTQGRGVTEKIDIPSLAWLLRGPGGPILVDTGMCETGRASQYHYPGSRQEPGQPIDEALAAAGVAPGEVRLIILTHLHWDHCHNLHRFPGARVAVQRREWDFARDPLPPYYRSYEHPLLGLEPPFAHLRPELVEGEARIAQGLSVFPTPGHSPGHQSVRVETAAGTYIVAGDAVMCYENLAGDPAHHLPFIMIGRYMSLEEAWRSLERIRAIGGTVLPGHETAVLAKPQYP